MGITATRLEKMNIIDGVIKEPLGGAHRDHQAAAENLKNTLIAELKRLTSLDRQELLEKRYQRLMGFGAFEIQALNDD
jgi:acetyl-CoA carboxylase carboxyl transferase subunit alpha